MSERVDCPICGELHATIAVGGTAIAACPRLPDGFAFDPAVLVDACSLWDACHAARRRDAAELAALREVAAAARDFTSARAGCWHDTKDAACLGCRLRAALDTLPKPP